MQQGWFRPFVVIGSTTIILLSLVAIPEAQLNQVRQVNMENARKLLEILGSQIQAGKRLDGLKTLDEFKANIKVVQDAIEKTGDGLHSKDKDWLKGTSKNDVKKNLDQLVTISDELKASLVTISSNPSGPHSKLSSTFNETRENLNKFWAEYFKKGTQLQEKAKVLRTANDDYIQKARNDSFKEAKKYYDELSNAIGAGNLDEAFKKDDAFYRPFNDAFMGFNAGTGRVKDMESEWLASTDYQKVFKQFDEVRGSLESMTKALANVDESYKGYWSNFKSGFESLDNNFDAFAKEFSRRTDEISVRAQNYVSECPDCK